MKQILGLAVAACVAVVALLSLGGGARADGASIYADHCAKCHGPDGAGDTPVGKAMKVPALNDPSWAELDADSLKKKIQESSKHKSVSGKVSDADYEALAAHIRQLAGADGS